MAHKYAQYEKYESGVYTRQMGNCPNMSECFYGSVTVGERGQIVIPAEARAEMDLKPGDKLLVMRHPTWKGLMISRIEDVQGFVDSFSAGITEAKNRVEEE